MQRSVHRLHTLQDSVFFSNFPLSANNTWFALNIFDWVIKSRIHQAKEEFVWVLPDISRSYHRTSLPQHHIPSDTVTMFIYYINSLCHIILESYQITFEDSQEIFKSTSSWTHLISMMDWLFPGTFHWLVAHWWLAGFPPGIQAMQTTRPTHQLIIGWQIMVPRYLLHLMFEWPQFVFKSKEPSNHLISSHFISIMDGLFYGKMSDISQISLRKWGHGARLAGRNLLLDRFTGHECGQLGWLGPKVGLYHGATGDWPAWVDPGFSDIVLLRIKVHVLGLWKYRLLRG